MLPRVISIQSSLPETLACEGKISYIFFFWYASITYHDAVFDDHLNTVGVEYLSEVVC
jgi:hypothetical protein